MAYAAFSPLRASFAETLRDSDTGPIVRLEREASI